MFGMIGSSTGQSLFGQPPVAEVAACAVQVSAAGAASGKYSLQPEDQELVFMGERCRDEQTLRDYGVCEPWIVQVRGLPVEWVT
jgi:hypothetical protein